MHQVEDLLGPIGPFLDLLCGALQRDGLALDGYVLDHLCYRVASSQRYKELKAALAHHAILLGENTIGGRPIATFRLHQPLRYAHRLIPCVELPAPKPGRPYAEGWEHAEWVIDEPLEAWVARYPWLDFDLRGLAKPLNAEVSLDYPGYAAKFHRQSLEEVIRREGLLGAPPR